MAVQELQQVISGAVPPPATETGQRPSVERAGVIVVDVSGSMRSALRDPLIVENLKELSTSNPTALWLAVDVTVRYEGRGASALDEVLRLEMTRNTSLSDALQGRAIQDAIVITDEEGQKQLRAGPVHPRLIGLVSGVVFKLIDAKE